MDQGTSLLGNVIGHTNSLGLLHERWQLRKQPEEGAMEVVWSEPGRNKRESRSMPTVGMDRRASTGTAASPGKIRSVSSVDRSGHEQSRESTTSGYDVPTGTNSAPRLRGRAYCTLHRDNC